MALTPLQVRDVCQSGSYYSGAKACKYHDQQTRSDGKWVSVCTKLNAGAYAALEAKRKGSYRYGGTPTGDNCQGYILLQYKDQGYDI